MTDMNPFEQRLAALEARYTELGTLLSAPDAYQDLDRIRHHVRGQVASVRLLVHHDPRIASQSQKTI